MPDKDARDACFEAKHICLEMCGIFCILLLPCELNKFKDVKA